MDVMFIINNLWIMICAALVFIMHIGFSVLEIGLTRTKNTTNVLFKNVFILCMGIVTYAVVGFNLMYPGEFNGVLALPSLGLSTGPEGLTSAYNAGYTYWTDFLFQAVFCATAATIVSGAVAERVKLGAFMLFTVPLLSFIYPILGSWKWGGGWLDAMGFHDFAGSSLVHVVGGAAALAFIKLLGAREGRYNDDGSINAIHGSSMPMATLGALLLWFGWFGFNGGSVLSADPGQTSSVLVMTCLAAAAGGLTVLVLSWVQSGKPELSMTLNGMLAGLVGITAGADQMSMIESLFIGSAAGVIVVFAVRFFDRFRLDDPVGATSVHLVCGIWGTMAVGLFGAKASFTQLGIQTLGTLVYAVAAFVASYVVLRGIQLLVPLRVTAEEEHHGLDKAEHGASAYSFTG